ncbi:MAG: cell division protein FtsQ/DivIB [Gammaproteobacteria bacterium]
MSRPTRTKSSQARQSFQLGDWYQRIGRRWLRNAFITLFATGVMVSGGSLLAERLAPGNLPIKRIELRGDLSRVDVVAVKKLVGPFVSGGVMRADVYDVAGLIEQRPWVERAWVRKRWPDTLEIQITTHQPAARWGDGAWLDTNGVVFKGSDQPDQQRFDVLHGPEGLEVQILEAYRKFDAALSSIGIDMKRLDVDQRRAWRIEAADELVIELGRERIEERLVRFVNVYGSESFGQSSAEGKKMIRADLRYPHGLAVLWKEPETAEPIAGAELGKG